MAWTLWIVAWVVGLSTLIMGIINGDLYGTQPVPMSYWAGFAVAIAYEIEANAGIKGLLPIPLSATLKKACRRLPSCVWEYL